MNNKLNYYIESYQNHPILKSIWRSRACRYIPYDICSYKPERNTLLVKNAIATPYAEEETINAVKKYNKKISIRKFYRKFKRLYLSS